MKITMGLRYTFFLSACLFFTPVFADDGSKANADNSIQRIGYYRDEALKLSPSDIYKELERQRYIQSIKNKTHNQTFFMDEDTYKAGGYAAALADKRKTNEPAAAFFSGLYNSNICRAMQSVDKGQLGSIVKDCWLESLESFKIASRANAAIASFNIARLYEGGLVVTF